jgi:class 3 adenylate cyclase
VADTVQGFGGFVAKYMGDGILIYFGVLARHQSQVRHLHAQLPPRPEKVSQC